MEVSRSLVFVYLFLFSSTCLQETIRRYLQNSYEVASPALCFIVVGRPFSLFFDLFNLEISGVT
jgi:hypothetical protein